MKIVNDFRLTLGKTELIPIVCGGMGVHFSGPALALEICRLGGVGHVSDAMSMFVADQKFRNSFSCGKARKFLKIRPELEVADTRFDLQEVYRAQMAHVEYTMQRKKGPGVIFLNVMEKLTMADPGETLRVRLNAALDAGVDGITLSAGLHTHSLRLIEQNARFREVKIGVVVSSCRALKIFLRGAKAAVRLPDYIIVEGPLAGGHLGFGEDWRQHDLGSIVSEILIFLKNEQLDLPVIPAGGIFTGGEAVAFLEQGAAAVQVATRFVVTEECGVSDEIKQRYFEARPEEVVVNSLSPTGYLMRMLSCSPCITRTVKPSCGPFGYLLNKEGRCQYRDEYLRLSRLYPAKRPVVSSKTCLCHHFALNSCYTCGHNVSRLKDTTLRNADGRYQLLTAAHVFGDYQFSRGDEIALPARSMNRSPFAFAGAEEAQFA